MQSQSEELVIGFDIGTTAVKGMVFRLNGEQVFAIRIPCPSDSPKPDWVEQDPETWMTCVKKIIQAAAAEIDLNAVKAIGVCSQVNTHIFLNAEGEVLEKAIIWQDLRCAEVAGQLETRARDRGMSMSIDASFLVSRAEWMAQYRPDCWQQTRWILSPKDYCILRLTGEVASDALSSVGLVTDDGIYNTSTIALVDGLAERLPPLRAITDIAGHCQHPDIPLKCPVSVGTMDAWASLYGSGLSKSGEGYQVSGTSEIIGLLSSENHPTAGVVSFPPTNGLYLHAGPTQAGGDALTWLEYSMGNKIDDILAFAESKAPLQEPLIFLPYLMGERAPLWDPTARATFVGLSKRHTKADMALAVFEGVGFSARHLTEEIEKAAGFSCDNLRLSGGAANSDLWCQIKANTMHRTLERVENINTGTFGAALIAMVGTGVYNSITEATSSAVRIEQVFEPNPSSLDWYDEIYRIYRETYTQLTPIFSSLYTLQHHYSN